MVRISQLIVWLVVGSAGIVFITNNTNEQINYYAKIVEQNHLESEEKKILTIATTFEDIKNSTEDNYRLFVQYNFLISTQFRSLRNRVNFVIFTDSAHLRNFIQQKYPHLIVFKEPKSNPFSVLMLKHIFITIMSKFRTPFYMYTNGDLLYDETLIQTVEHIDTLLEMRLLRHKLLIIGRRLNRVLTHYVRGEEEIAMLAKKSKLFIKEAQDYFIVTRETINWRSFPEYLVGRSGYDNALVQFAFRNEIELIDATQTIRALHQSNVRGEFLWKENNEKEHGWNRVFWAPGIQHPFTDSARYTTNFSENGEIVLYDKARKGYIDPRSSHSFQAIFNMDILFDPSHNDVKRVGLAKLKIIVLAYNRPEGLRRLLASLQSGHYGTDRVDLSIHLDTSPMNLYDLECLRVVYTFRWSYGSYQIERHTTHYGRIKQWVNAWKPESNEQKILILEDSMLLSEYFYEAVQLRSKQLEGLSGMSLEPSFTTNRKNKHNPSKVFSHTTLVLNNFKRSGAFMPNPRCWSEFINWMGHIQGTKFDTQQLKRAPAFQHHFHGYYTDWYATDISVWFSFFTEFVSPHSTGYIGDRNGFIASRLYFNSRWDEFYNGEWESEYFLLKSSSNYLQMNI